MQKKARATACTVGQFKELQVGNTNKLFIKCAIKVRSKPGQIDDCNDEIRLLKLIALYFFSFSRYINYFYIALRVFSY